MLKPHEIFSHMPSETANKLFAYFIEKDKPFYKATIDSLAKQRKLRPVFIERKSRAEKNAWLKESLSRKQNEAVAAHLLQIWLVGEHKELLCDFLDALNITHDENGTIDSIPPCPPKADIQRALETLLAKHELSIIAIYLHAFQALDEQGWPALEEILKEDERLRLGAAAAPASAS